MRIGRPSITVAGRMSNGVGLTSVNDQLGWTSLRPAGSISIGLRLCYVRHPSLAGLVVLAGSLYPIPSRTRPSNFPAPMVLSLKTWKSRSLPGLPRTETSSRLRTHAMREPREKAAAALPRRLFAFWASVAAVPVAWKMHRGDGRFAARTLRLHRERDHL